MMLGTQTIVVVRDGPSVEDEYHNEVSGEPTRHEVRGCSVQPGLGGVVVDRREATTTVYTVWAPVDADVEDTDDVEVFGQRFSVDGSVQRWAVGTPLDHLVIPLRTVRG